VKPAVNAVSVVAGISTGGIVITTGVAGDSGNELTEPVRRTSPPLALSVMSMAQAPLGGTGGEAKFKVNGVAEAAVTEFSAEADVGGENTEPVRIGKGE
jgi:hypothetical protein